MKDAERDSREILDYITTLKSSYFGKATELNYTALVWCWSTVQVVQTDSNHGQHLTLRVTGMAG